MRRVPFHFLQSFPGHGLSCQFPAPVRHVFGERLLGVRSPWCPRLECAMSIGRWRLTVGAAVLLVVLASPAGSQPATSARPGLAPLTLRSAGACLRTASAPCSRPTTGGAETRTGRRRRTAEPRVPAELARRRYRRGHGIPLS